MILSGSGCRSDWPLAVVQEVCPGPADGLSGKAVVRVTSGKTFVRNVRRLILLEAAGGIEDKVDSPPSSNEPEVEHPEIGTSNIQLSA